MKKLLLIALMVLVVGASFAEETNIEAYFEKVAGSIPDEEGIQLVAIDSQYSIAVPDNWVQIEFDGALLAFSGTDETGNEATIHVETFDDADKAVQQLEIELPNVESYRRLIYGGTIYNIMITLEKKIATVWESDVKQYAVIAELKNTEAFISEKLAADLNHILCGVKEAMDEEDEGKIYRYDQEAETVTEVKNSTLLYAISAEGVNVEMGELVTLSDTLTYTVPSDWVRMEEDFSHEGIEYVGSDDQGNSVAFLSMKVPQSYGSLQILQKDMEQNGTSFKAITWHGIDMFYVNDGLNGIDDFETIFCVKEDGTLLILGVLSLSGDVMRSEKLLTDLTAIVHSIKLVDGAKVLSFNEELPVDGDEVTFHDAEFERMIRAALNREEGQIVYSSELEAIKTLNIRSGKMTFTRNVIEYESYSQPDLLNLIDLRLFPNLEYLDITGMICRGFEIIAKLPALRELILIRTGLEDCSFLEGLELKQLDLAGNNISDFSFLTKVTGLEDVNLAETGLPSLDPLKGLDLTSLVVAYNPISDFEIVGEMPRLRTLYVQGTNISSLKPLRELKNLEILSIEDLKKEISLEPLYDQEKLLMIFANGTYFSEEDMQRFSGKLFGGQKSPENENTEIDMGNKFQPSGTLEIDCMEQISAFMEAWNKVNLDELVEMSTEEWKESRSENLKACMFGLLANRTPLDYRLNELVVEDDEANAKLTTLIDRNNGKEPKSYYQYLRLVRENDIWHIDPNSLKSYEGAQ